MDKKEIKRIIRLGNKSQIATSLKKYWVSKPSLLVEKNGAVGYEAAEGMF